LPCGISFSYTRCQFPQDLKIGFRHGNTPARQISSHPAFTLVARKNRRRHFVRINTTPENMRLCGENLSARPGIIFNALTNYFYVFAIQLARG
jgi:hypothetical protein